MKKTLLFIVLALVCSWRSSAQFSTSNVVTGLPYPIAFEIAPDGRYFVTCKGGASGTPSNAQVRVYTTSGTLQNVLWDFTDSVQIVFERGVLGIALDPDFSTNHYVYVFYNHTSPEKIRVVRFTETAGIGSSPVILLDINDPHSAGNHTGGNIHFRPSDPNHLYISIGDRADDPNEAQDLSKWNGKILRIHKNGSIPADNPYYDDGNPSTGNDDRIWTYGHRNPFDFTFSTLNDSLYSSENGENTNDEVNLVTKGLNYGWPECEGITDHYGTCAGYTAPLEVWTAPLPAVTGIIFYTSPVMPAYTNHLLVTDYNYGHISDITLGNPPYYDQFVSRSQVTGLSLAGLTDIAQGPEGCWYVLQGGYTSTGKLTRICPTGMGIDEAKAQSFSITPNPAENMVTVQGGQVESIVVLDLNGKRVLQNSHAHTIDVSGLPAGIYQVQVNGYSVQKLVKW